MMSLPVTEWSGEELKQMYHVWLCVSIEGPSALKQKLCPIPPDLRWAMNDSTEQSLKNLTSFVHNQEAIDFLEKEVFVLLKEEMGVDIRAGVSPFPDDNTNDDEEVDPSSFLNIDIACPDKKLAIEFNGPNRHLRMGYGKLNGQTMMKKRLVEKLGWTVVGIHWFEYFELETREEKLLFLAKRLKE